jgi:ubiquinone biosynthesis O-methyltransferase
VREKAKFEADAALWWNEREGPFAALHGMNPTRVAFIRDAMRRKLAVAGEVGLERSLEGLRVCDVGCGGGILAESLARLGAQVTAIDAGPAKYCHCPSARGVGPEFEGYVEVRGDHGGGARR